MNDFSRFEDRPGYDKLMTEIFCFRTVFYILIGLLFTTLAVEYGIILKLLVM